MTNIIIKVVKKELRSIIKKNKKEIKKKERLKYWFMPECDKEIVRKRSLGRYYKIKYG